MRYKIIEGFLSSDECKGVIESAKTRLHVSTAWNVKEGRSEISDYRRSEQMYYQIGENQLIRDIEQRVSSYTGLPVENGEGLQIVHYTKGGYYKNHWDYFDPAWAGNQGELGRGGQRVITCLMYLNTVSGSGETNFPYADLRIEPKEGKAIIWHNIDEQGNIDKSTFHEAVPVGDGVEKWIATKWLRAGTFR